MPPFRGRQGESLDRCGLETIRFRGRFWTASRYHHGNCHPTGAFDGRSRPQMPRAVLLALLLLLPAAAWPYTSPSVFLEELTWTEVRDAVKAGKTTVIVPIGGTEQSGPHI